MKKYKLFLDDVRNPEMCTLYRTKHMMLDRSVYSTESWVVVRSYNEFVETIKMKFYAGEWPTLISFDHDLADEHYDPKMYGNDEDYPQVFSEKTGTDCAKWLFQFCIQNNLDLPEYTVHSMNPIGAERIKNELDSWKKYKQLKVAGKL
jgi:hypothetical protein